MLIDLKNPVHKSEDLRLLSELMSALNGQLFLKAGHTYPSALVLHLGNPIAYVSKKPAGNTKGSWRLKADASLWQMLLAQEGSMITDGAVPIPPDSVVTSIPEEEVEKKITASLAGKTVSRVHPFYSVEPGCPADGIGLVLRFEEGSTFVLRPSTEPDPADIEGDPVPDWELFTPFEMYLRVGPGLGFSYIPANVPDLATAQLVEK